MQKKIFYIDPDSQGYAAMFVPVEVKSEILDRFNTFRETDKGTSTRVYNHTPFSKTLDSRDIDIRSLFTSMAVVLPAYDEVRFEDFPDDVISHFFAFGTQSCFIFATSEKNNSKILKSLDFYKGFSKQRERDEEFDKKRMEQLAKLLYKIGQDYNLLLVDWKEHKIIDFNDLETISEYIHTPWFLSSK